MAFKMTEYGEKLLQSWNDLIQPDIDKGSFEGTFRYEDKIETLQDAAGWCLLTYGDNALSTVVQEWIRLDHADKVWGFDVYELKAELEKCLVDERLVDIDFVMTNYFGSIFYGAELVEKNGVSFTVDYEGKRLLIEFDTDWSEYVYTINGKGPFAHSSYEYIGSDCRQVLALEEHELKNSIHSLASKLNDFYKEFDFYDYMDSIDVGEHDIIDKLLVQLREPDAVGGMLETLRDIKENGEPDEEQARVLDELIEEVTKVQTSLGKSLDEKLSEAKEKCSLTENEMGNDKGKDVEVLKE